MTEQARCQGSGPDDELVKSILKKHREHNKQASSAHRETAFSHQMSGALERQDILLGALHSHLNFDAYVDLESSQDMDSQEMKMDMQGTDVLTVHEDSEEVNTVAFKTRSPYKRDFADLDLGLRVTGRSGGFSHEWDKFEKADREVADYMVYALFHSLPGDPLPAEVMVIDYKLLKEEFFRGEIDVSPEIDMAAKNDNGSGRYVDAGDIRESDALVWHRKYWSDEIETKGESRKRDYSRIELDDLDEDEQDDEGDSEEQESSNGLPDEAIFPEIDMLKINYELHTIVRDKNSSDELLVVGKHKQSASDVTLSNSNTTLSDYNDCCEDEGVYACVYLDKAIQAVRESPVDFSYDSLREAFNTSHAVIYTIAGAAVGIDDPDWLETDLEPYYFPDSRLERVENINEVGYLDKVERQAKKLGDVFERMSEVALRYTNDEPSQEILEEYNVIDVDAGSNTLVVHQSAQELF